MMRKKHLRYSERIAFLESFYSIFFAITLILILLPGCGYPDVSGKTYEISKALYSACNRQSDEQLTKIESVISNAIESEEISAQESKWLNQIIKTARDGDWEAATAESRKLMEDQIKY